MSLFNFGKKKEEEQKTSDCACSCECTGSTQAKADTNNCCSDTKSGEICCIKVLGSGCKSCHELYENVNQAVKELELSIEVEYITDMQKIMEYGVMSMPAIVINEKVASMGKVLKTKDVISLLQEQGA